MNKIISKFQRLRKKDDTILLLQAQIAEMERKDVERMIKEEDLKKQVEKLKKENEALKSACVCHPSEYLSSQSGSQRKGKLESENSLYNLLDIDSSSLRVPKGAQIQEIEIEEGIKQLKGTLGKFKLAENQKLVSDEEGRVVEVSFRRMLKMLLELEGLELQRHLRTVFVSYRKVCTPLEMLMHMMEMYCEVERGEKQKRGLRKVATLLKYWMQHFPFDWQEEEMEEELFNFLEDTLNPTLGGQVHKDLANTLEMIFSNTFDQTELVNETPKKTENSSQSQVLPLSAVSLFEEFEAAELARILIMRDQDYWKAIDQRELFHFKAHSKNTTINALTENFNMTGRWALSSLIRYQELKPRVKTLEKLIEVAYVAKSVLAFNVMVATVAALNSTPIRRLERTWQGVSEKQRKKWEEMEKLAHPSRNYAALRDACRRKREKSPRKKPSGAVRKSSKPSPIDTDLEFTSDSADNSESETDSSLPKLVLKGERSPSTPFFGLLLKDLLLIEESGPSLTAEGLVNFHKLSLLADTVDQILQVRESLYDFKINPSLKNIIFATSLAEEKDALLLSKKIEN